MQNSIDVLKRMETESKRFINIEKEGAIEEFHQCVFEEIFRKGMGYTFCSPMDWNDEQQLYIVNHKLKIKTTLDEVDEISAANRLFRDSTKQKVKDSDIEWGIIISPKGIWLFNNNIGKGKSEFQTKKTVLEIVYGINSDQYYFDFFSYNNILGRKLNAYFFKDIAEYRNCYYKGGENSWPAYSSAIKRFLKYCSIDRGMDYLKSETDSIYDAIELPDFYEYIAKKTKLRKENTLKSAFFYIKSFMSCMSDKGIFNISTKEMLDGFSRTLKQNERQNVIDANKLKKAIQYLEAGNNRERDTAMFLTELSFGLERRKLRSLKWEENFDLNDDGSIGDIFKLEGKKIRMPEELIRALNRLRALGVGGDYVFYRTRDNGEEPMREDVINDVFSKLTKVDPKDEYYKSLTPANIRSSLVRYLLRLGTPLEKIIYLMNIEIWNLGNYISLEDIDCLIEQRNEKEGHPMEEFLEKLK